jgi:hypothetical protein
MAQSDSQLQPLHVEKTIFDKPTSEHAETNKLPPPEPGSEWVHTKGTIYTVIGVSSPPDDAKADEFPVTVLYVGPDGRKWPRTLKRWYASMTLVKQAKFRPNTLLSHVHVALILWRAQKAAQT